MTSRRVINNMQGKKAENLWKRDFFPTKAEIPSKREAAERLRAEFPELAEYTLVPVQIHGLPPLVLQLPPVSAKSLDGAYLLDGELHVGEYKDVADGERSSFEPLQYIMAHLLEDRYKIYNRAGHFPSEEYFDP